MCTAQENINNTHVASASRPYSLSLVGCIHPFLFLFFFSLNFQCAVSSLPTPSSPVPLFVFLSALSLSLRRRANGGIRNWRRGATTDFLGFFSSSGKSAPLESHAGIYVNTARWMII
jgi:hypothetical protein